MAYRLPPPALVPELDIPPTFPLVLGTFEEETATIINSKIKSYFAKVMTERDTYCEPVFEERQG